MNQNDIGGRFSNLQQIHRGQWAVSYSAFDNELKTPVFLKILNTAFHNDTEFVERFDREVEFARKLKHANVVQLIDSGSYGSTSFITFEWINGKILNEFIVSPGAQSSNNGQYNASKPAKLSLPTVLHYATQLFSGVQAIHEAGIIHRDIKPSNIIADENGTIKVLDFSLSYIPEDIQITPHENVVGTPGYLAPEVVAGAKANEISDLFSAGIVLYELLTNKALFNTGDIYTTLQKVHDAEVPNIMRIREDIPLELWNILKKLLSKHPFDRYANAAAALDELKKVNTDVFDGVSIVSEKKPSRRKTYRYLFLGAALAITLILAKFMRVPQNQQSGLPGDIMTAVVDSGYPASVMPKDSSVILIDNQYVLSGLQDSLELEVSVSDSIISSIEKFQQEDSSVTPNLPEIAEAIYFNPVLNQETVAVALDEIPVEPIYPDSIEIYFTIYPWAKVYCDGRFLGTSPIIKKTSVKCGLHEFSFEHPDFPTFTELIDLQETDSAAFNLDLTKEFGRLEFIVEPWAYLDIDGLDKGTLPIAKPIYLTAGEHSLKMWHPDFAEIERVIDVLPGETLTINADFAENKTRDEK